MRKLGHRVDVQRRECLFAPSKHQTSSSGILLIPNFSGFEEKTLQPGSQQDPFSLFLERDDYRGCGLPAHDLGHVLTPNQYRLLALFAVLMPLINASQAALNTGKVI